MNVSRFRVVRPYRASNVEELSLRVGDIVECTLADAELAKTTGRLLGVNQSAGGEVGEFPFDCVESDVDSVSWDSDDDIPSYVGDTDDAEDGPMRSKGEDDDNPRSLSRRMSIAKLKSALSGGRKTTGRDRSRAMQRSISVGHTDKLTGSARVPLQFAVGDYVCCIRPFAAMGLDELSLSVGDVVCLIKNHGTRWQGSTEEGEIGWFDEEIVQPLSQQKDVQPKKSNPKKSKSVSHIPDPNHPDQVKWIPEVGKVVFAVSEHAAKDLDGLCIATGDVITLVERVSEKLWRGENQAGEIGVFDVSAVVPDAAMAAVSPSKGSISSRGSDKSSGGNSTASQKSARSSRSKKSSRSSTSHRSSTSASKKLHDGTKRDNREQKTSSSNSNKQLDATKRDRRERESSASASKKSLNESKKDKKT